MALQPYEHFEGVTNWTDDQFSENLKYGLKEWIQWSFLQIGAFQNIDVGQASGLYGGHAAILRPVDSPNYAAGRVWESFRGDWVWETGVEYTIDPVVCSGVYVGNTFYPTSGTSGTYAHYINFLDGQIVFAAAIPVTSVVKASYSYRLVNVVDIKVNWFTELLFNSVLINRTDFLDGGGSYNQLAQARRYMPVIGLEIVDRPTPRPYQLGGGQIFYQDVLLYILSENEPYLNNIIDILTYQNDKVIFLPNKKTVKADADYPHSLDYRGMTVSNPLMYTGLIASFPWEKIKLTNARTQKFSDLLNNIYKGTIRFTCETILENI